MANRSSRHAQLATYRRRLPVVDQEVELYQPRLRQTPPSNRLYRTRPGDRLDHLAFRFYDDPHQYWRLADANPDRELPDLVRAGYLLRVPERRR